MATLGPGRDFERLSKAITEAVMSSAKVRKIVAEIQRKEKICPQSFMVLVLKMQVLAESLDTMEAGEPLAVEPKKTRRPRRKSAKDQTQFIDGAKLSKNEIAFQEFVNERFDMEKWLKRNGISL